MLWNRLLHWCNRFVQQPWQWWGGCTDPDLSRYIMDYAFGWLDNPRAVPELAAKAHELKAALDAHITGCRQCQENLASWRTTLDDIRRLPRNDKTAQPAQRA
ncbi:MAG: hypothetical protein HYR55_06980 [Acidobacteria bacterium]|nr:hypothetical protein [Acidobacteriota bacterium]MBI3656222.1 hypothetical protein [Acidobacteriota bacterium]